MFIKKIVSFFFAFLLFAPLAHAVTADVTDISNRAYSDVVIREIDNAKLQIDAAIYSLYLGYDAEPDPEITPATLCAAFAILSEYYRIGRNRVVI